MPAGHLAASMRVVASHLNMRRVIVAVAKEKVKGAALHVATDVAGPEAKPLAAKLAKATGAPIAELAVFADDWPG